MSPDSLLIVPELLSQLERDAIVECFKGLLRTRAIKTNHFDITLPNRPAMFVKYGNSDILAEASTQSFFYALAQGDSEAPGIPCVYGAFRGAGRHFLIMEKVNKPTLAACDSIEDAYAVEHAAFAVGWLLGQMPRIPASVFGRISAEKACVWHQFFKNHRAPLTFVNSEAVAKYVNKAFLRRPSSAKPISISFSDELFIYHSDISKDNFLLDPVTGQIWIIDFQHIGVFPEPFQQFGLFNIDNSFAAAVGKFLDIHPSDIANVMTKASGVLQQIAGGGSLGLNEFGERASAKETTEQSEPSYVIVREGALYPV